MTHRVVSVSMARLWHSLRRIARTLGAGTCSQTQALVYVDNVFSGRLPSNAVSHFSMVYQSTAATRSSSAAASYRSIHRHMNPLGRHHRPQTRPTSRMFGSRGSSQSLSTTSTPMSMIMTMTINISGEDTTLYYQTGDVNSESQSEGPPVEPEPGACCGNDCHNCVWILYWEELEAYKRKKHNHSSDSKDEKKNTESNN